MYLATGEYSPKDTWDAILRFDDAQDLTGTTTADGVAADATVPIKEVSDEDDVSLNFVHSLYLWEQRNELFVSSLFTTADGHACGDGLGPNGEVMPTFEDCGSIGVLAEAARMDGPQKLARHLFGKDTRINQAHGLFVDESRDLLYVANSALNNPDHRGILVFETESTADGNTPPDRHLEVFGIPVHVYVDGPTDRLFVVTMSPASVLIYPSASTLDGPVTAGTTIMGPSTRLDEGNNQTTHNVWFNATAEQIIVGHHTNEVLFYDVSGVNIDSAGTLDLAPRVLEVNDTSSDMYDWSTYGFFYVRERARLYVSTGHTAGGTASKSGGPNRGGEHQIKVYEGVSDPAVNGRVAPERRIFWDSWETYYPPQPLWVVHRGAAPAP